MDFIKWTPNLSLDHHQIDVQVQLHTDWLKYYTFEEDQYYKKYL